MYQKIQIFAELGFLRSYSEYACVNFFAHIYISMILALTRRAAGAAWGLLVDLDDE